MTFVISAVHDPAVGMAVVTASHHHGLSAIVVHALDRNGVETVLDLPRPPCAVFVHIGGQPLHSIRLIDAIRRRAPDAVVVGMLEPSSVDDDLAAANTADLVWPLPVERRDLQPFMESEVDEVLRARRSSHPRTLVVDAQNYRATLGSDVVELTPTECALLEELIRSAGRVVSRASLSQAVWGHEGCAGNVLERHVCRLRQKAQPLAKPLIRTVHGVGYEFVYDRYAVI